MSFEEFETAAWAEWERIPERFKEGIDGLIVRRKAKPHRGAPGAYTLGECLTESYPSDFGGPDTIRSAVVLYWGSFRALAEEDPSFDWRTELWETLTHELQHHLESLAADEALLDLDYAMDEHFKREDGQPFDPFYYRGGEPHDDGWYRVEDLWFLERPADAPIQQFDWAKRRYEVHVPDRTADVTFVVIHGVKEAPAALNLVLVRPRGLGSLLRSALGRATWRVDELDVDAREIPREDPE